MEQILISLLFSFLLTIFLIILLIKNAKKLKIIDYPNHRSSHTQPKPRGAGIGIFLSFIITIAIFHTNFFIENLYFFISIFLVFLIGFIDDRKDTNPKIKFIFISLSIVLLFFMTDLKISSLGLWFGYYLYLPTFISLIITLFVVNGFTNALNLVDGLDGLAGGISLVILTFFLYLGIVHHDEFIIIVSSIIISSIFAFLLFNWYPAKIFMGDSGSLFLGFIISVLAIKLIQYINIVAILFLTAIPILDTLIVMIRRIQRGLSPFSADKNHIHHKIVRWKVKIDFSVFLILLIQLIFSLLGIILSHYNNFLDFIIFIIITFLIFILFDDRKAYRKNSIININKILADNLLYNKYISYILFISLCLILFLNINKV